MKFDIKCVKEFLKENGFVFTVRSYDYGELSHKSVEGIGKILVKKIGEIKEEADLIKYQDFSGFVFKIKGLVIGDSTKWWEVIERFCKGKPKYLYLVVKEE